MSGKLWNRNTALDGKEAVSRRRTVGLLVALTTLAVMLVIGVVIAGSRGGNVASNGAEQCTRGNVALTFDDGPDVHTTEILAVLHRYHSQATFFVIGSKASARSDLVRAEVAEGHLVENHSWSHPHLNNLAPAQIRDELVRAQDAIIAAGAPSPALFRPPYGKTGPVIEEQVRAMGLRTVQYTVDTNDWRGVPVADIVNVVLNFSSNGSVILMHDGLRESRNTVQALPSVISGLRARGFCTTLPTTFIPPADGQ